MNERLAYLAELHGIATEYWDQSGGHHDAGAETVIAVLAALGVAAGQDTGEDPLTEAAIVAAENADWRAVLPPVYVHRRSREGRIWVHVPDGSPVAASITLEGGSPVPAQQVEHLVEPRHIDDRVIGEAMFLVPSDLPLGWHTFSVTLDGTEHSTPLVVTPDRLPTPPRGWGLMTQLYSLRSRTSWGLGDLGDLTALAHWAGERGADFVLVNPLHASLPITPMEPSPYLPATRRFANPLYLRVELIPEYHELPDADRGQVARLHDTVTPANSSSALLDRDAAWHAKRTALEIVWRSGTTDERISGFQEFCRSEGVGLQDFALWCALSEEYGDDWHEWPVGLQDPRSPEVTVEFARLEERVLFHSWLQWLLDEQLGFAQAEAGRAGMSIGIVHDLAVGVHRDGADAWRLGSVLASDVTVGAPPDIYNQLGQDWSQPPWRPDELAAKSFIPYRDMLRTILRHAGGIRVDHILGLYRQWWIPEGFSPAEGTYVQVDNEAMVGILLLEAARVGAVVVGEDLGTVEDWIRDDMLERGLLGTGVLWFERGPEGIRTPEHWRELALAAVTVHDLPPTAGYILGEHVRLRHELNLLTRPLENEEADHQRELAEWVRVVQEAGFLEPEYTTDDLVVALHRLLASSSARLLGVNLPDLVGDMRTQNQPGTNREYSNWRIPVCDSEGRPVLLEDLEASSPTGLAARIIAAVQ